MKVQIEMKGVKEALEILDPKVHTKALVSTLNRVGSMAATQAKRKIRETYNIRQKDIKVMMQRASDTFPTAYLKIPHQASPLILFGGKHSRKMPGARVEVIRGNRKVITSSFITNVKAVTKGGDESSHAGIFRRVAKTRLHIKQLYGPSPGGMMREQWPEMQVYISSIFLPILEHNITFWVVRLAKGA